MAANKLIFQDAEKARDAILESQKKEIANLYNEWANDIGKRAKFYKNKTTSSSWVSEQQMKQLQKQLKATSKEVSTEIEKKIKNNMYLASDAVVKCNQKWLSQFGFDSKGINAAFSNVNDSVIRNIVTGNVYDSGWSLSNRIWGMNQDIMKNAYQVVAKGLAENMSVYDIAKNLEAYVRPDAKKPWNPVLKMQNTKTGKYEFDRIFKRQVDYNAQRLARTLVQHSYQQSVIATTQKNPFITEYIWNANGSRVCPLCRERDGVHYKKNELPMDHPNGMCIIIPDVAEDIEDQIANWINSPDGTFPEIDEFAKNFGYTPSVKTDVKSNNNERLDDMFGKFFTSTNYSKENMPDFYDWYVDLDSVQQKEFIKYAGIDTKGKKSYQIKNELNDFYNSIVKGTKVTKQTVVSSVKDTVKSKVEKTVVSTVKKETQKVVKQQIVPQTSKVNVASNIRSKNLQKSISTAFDRVKSDSRLKIDVDKVISNVRYAEGNEAKRLIRQNAGAMAQGKSIVIEKSAQKYIDADFITHEIGHKVTVYGNKMTDATAKRVANELVKELGYKDIKSMSSYVSDYATKNPTELFPEAFMEYYSGKELKGNKKKIVEAIMNKMYFK